MNMASDFQEIYSKKIQIFATTHSPAFISLKSQHTALYRAYKTTYQTKLILIKEEDQEGVGILNEELGLTKLLQEQHAFYLSKLEEYEAQKEELEKLKKIVAQHSKPTILTEGKTDVLILKTAWSKLYPDKEIPFNITSCDLEDGDVGGGSGGCNILKKYLESVRHDNPHISIGLFDFDKAGIDAFKLDKNYSTVEGYSNVKKSKNSRGYALLLPVPEGKEDFATSYNLSIEFYFDEEDLFKEVDGHKLEVIYPVVDIPLKGIVIGQHQTTELYHAQIVNRTKTNFAKEIVPTFGAQSFKNFDALFSIFDKIISGVI
ncbi:hypothetical protein D1872_211910 [compost metagenome]